MIQRLSKLVILSCLVVATQGQVSHAQVASAMSLEQMQRNLAKIDKSIDETRGRIKNVRDARFLPDLYFALAEFYVDKSRFMYAIKVAQSDGAPIEEIDFAAEKRPKLKAIEVYQSIIDKFPKLKERDKALFFKAHEMRELGQLENMILTYQKLTREYPKSEFWNEGQLVVGDFYFEEKKDFALALRAYQKILRRPISSFTPLAHYKIGWIHINKTKFKKAMLSFERVLTSSKKVSLDDLPELYKKTDVRRDALLAIVWPYSEMSKKQLSKMGGGRTNQIDYFYRLSPDRISYEKSLHKLGRRLGLKHKYIAASHAYFELLRTTSDLEVRMDVVERLYVSMKNTHKLWPVRGFVNEIIETLNRVRNDPYLKKGAKKKAIHDYEIFSRDIATRQHKRAKKTRANQDWQWTIRDYESYLWAFPKTKHTAKILLNLAEAYYHVGDFINAAKRYEQLARITRSKKMRREYWDSSIQSYIRALRNQSKLSRLHLAEVRSGIRGVGRHFVKNYPKNKAVASIRFNIAQTFYDERDFSAAIKNLKYFMKRHPRNSKVTVAANLILDALNQKEDWAGIIREGKLIVADKKIRNRSLKQQVKQIVQQAELKQVQEKSGDFSSPQYASNLLKFASKHKGSSLGDRALYEAFVAFKSKKDPRAYTSGEQLLVQHGKSKYAKEVVSQMGQMALITADFRRASLYFELYNEKFPRDPDAKKLLGSAANMRELMGDLKIAARDYNKMGDPVSAARMDFLGGDWAALRRSAPRAGGPQGQYWEGLAQYRLRGIGPARGSLESAAKSSSGSNEMAAHALYLLATDALSRYKQVQIKAGQEAKAVNNKSAMLKALEQKLNRVIKFGNGRWTIAGLYGLGQAYAEFASFIRRAPVPKGLSGAQKKQYKAALAKQAASYAKSASGYFKQCIQAAEKHEIFTNFVKGCQSKGRIAVDESKETRLFVRAREQSPPGSKAIRKQLMDQSRNTKLLRKLARSYLKSKDYSMAELVLNRSLEVKQSAVTMAEIGVVKLYKNELEEAKQWFKKALASHSRNGTALYGLAGLYKKFGFSLKLKQTLRKARGSKYSPGFIHPYMRAAM